MTTTVYENPWFRVVHDDGYYYLHEPNALNCAAVLAILENKDIILLRIRRKAQGSHALLEIPRGFADEYETSRQCASRELLEETGFKVDPNALQYLGACRPNTTLLSSRVHIYLALLKDTDLVGVPDNEADAVQRVPLAQVVDLLAKGALEDGFTLSALALYFAKDLS